MCLADAEFNDDRPAGAKQFGRRGGNDPIVVEPVGPAVEGGPGIEIAHLGRERGDVVGANVGRVR